MTAAEAIAKSLADGEIVTLDHDQHTYEELLKLCSFQEGDVPDGQHTFWGLADGEEWCVTMRAEVLP